MDDNKSKSASDIKDASVRRFKALKRPSADTDNPMVKMRPCVANPVLGTEGN
jgi:hypothetical protein